MKSEENPADVITRGIRPKKLKNLEICWKGPEWLKTGKLPEKIKLSDTNQEIKKKFLTHHALKNDDITSSKNEDMTTKYSRLSTLLRVLSYCQRFIENCRTK